MDNSCSYKEGSLPSCAPLSVPYVPPQGSAQPAYDSAEALAKGTLFPGLDLPFMNYISKSGAPDTPITELMALDFVAHELALYLDTHKNDQEAFAAYQNVTALAAEGRRRYVALYGPITVPETAACPDWAWINDPWPWEPMGKEARR